MPFVTHMAILESLGIFENLTVFVR